MSKVESSDNDSIKTKKKKGRKPKPKPEKPPKPIKTKVDNSITCKKGEFIVYLEDY